MKCSKCLRKDYCVYIHQFDHNTNVGCIEFQDREYTTYISNTLNTKENKEEYKSISNQYVVLNKEDFE